MDYPRQRNRDKKEGGSMVEGNRHLHRWAFSCHAFLSDTGSFSPK